MFFTTSCEVFNNTDVPQKWLQIESDCRHFTDIKKKEDTLKHTHTLTCSGRVDNKKERGIILSLGRDNKNVRNVD